MQNNLRKNIIWFPKIMIAYSIVFLTFFHFAINTNLPCANNCASCSSSTECTTCALQYYASSSNGTLTCLSCSAFCLQCTSSAACTQCLDPYVLSNGTCHMCQISNAAKCSNVVSASQCITRYYASDNYCYNCLLNCA